MQSGSQESEVEKNSGFYSDPIWIVKRDSTGIPFHKALSFHKSLRTAISIKLALQVGSRFFGSHLGKLFIETADAVEGMGGCKDDDAIAQFP